MDGRGDLELNVGSESWWEPGMYTSHSWKGIQKNLHWINQHRHRRPALYSL